jgi:di/tricarboxylate transporter
MGQSLFGMFIMIIAVIMLVRSWRDIENNAKEFATGVFSLIMGLILLFHFL